VANPLAAVDEAEEDDAEYLRQMQHFAAAAKKPDVKPAGQKLAAPPVIEQAKAVTPDMCRVSDSNKLQNVGRYLLFIFARVGVNDARKPELNRRIDEVD